MLDSKSEVLLVPDLPTVEIAVQVKLQVSNLFVFI